MNYRAVCFELLAECSTLKAKNKMLLASLESITDAASKQLPQGSDHDDLTNCDLIAYARKAIAKAKGGE